ncbi:fmi1 protein [Diaporthe amygdali]|uniref:fmi1 protein n=1 Tax=Phomopsis amygdali TaxID=1214568 RepID=UPI0022FE17EF|nr:fmi1 protein [Diaporthe amygdali]KAJ0117082.1 fmi1 protein [Diaporthe amygdali]
MSLYSLQPLSRLFRRRFAHSLQRFYSARSRAPAFTTVPACPPSTCECAATPAMPDGLEIDHKGKLNGLISNYNEQVLICTGKDDWPSRIEEDNSGDNLAADLKELFGRGGVYSDPFHNISVLNSSFASSVPARTELVSTSVYLLPSFKYVPFLPRVSFDSVEALAKGFLLPEKLHSAHDGLSPIHRDRLTRKPMYGQLLPGVRDVEDILVLICGHGGRDMRCGVMGPVLRSEFETQLAHQGVEVLRGPVVIDASSDAEAITGPVQKPALAARVGLISHIGGHKFAGNIIIYLPPSLKMASGDKHPLAGHGICCGRAVASKHGKPEADEVGNAMSVRGLSTYTTTPTPQYQEERLSAPSYPARPRGPVRGFASTTLKRNTASPKNHEKKTRTGRPLAILTIAILGAALLSATTDVGSGTPKGVLNGESFVPFKVVSTERTSPTTFILTISAPTPHQATNATLIQGAWAHGLWSVEIKQPQLQIARNYTPLPPAVATAGGDGDGPKATLRFLVRRYDGGEMSTYLSRLGPGDEVWLRGPHLGFDVDARLGAAGERVVFLAGGTGIAPALQAARHLLLSAREGKGRKVSMEIIWANRARADCAGCPRLPGEVKGFWGRLSSAVAGGSAPREDRDFDGLGHPVVQELRDLQAAYRARGHELEFRCVADDEGGAISTADVTRAVQYTRTLPPPTALVASVLRAPCYFHSQRQLQHSTHESDAGEDGLKGQGGSGTTMRECACGDKGASGKHLLMISGPDGFVSAYVGRKVWADGAERQGPVGGLVRKLMEKSPEAWRDWLVLKQ